MDQINNRQQLAHQYFEIRIALNKANGSKNDKTDLEFELRSNGVEEFVIIKSSGAHHGLRVATKTSKLNSQWITIEHPQFNELFIYLLIKIKVMKNFDQLNGELTVWLFRLWMI